MEIGAAEKPSQAAAPDDPADSPTRQSGLGGEAGSATCRVCLEEDGLANLMAPCSCTGSMMVRSFARCVGVCPMSSRSATVRMRHGGIAEV